MNNSCSCLVGAAVAATICWTSAVHAQADGCEAIRHCVGDDAWCAVACPVIPPAGAARHEALAALDGEARAAAGQGLYEIATERFVCLFRADPRAETAGSLSVVLRERGLLDNALTVARCAESLSSDGPARARALSRREDIERRANPPTLPPPEPAARAVVEDSRPPLSIERDETTRGRPPERALVTLPKSPAPAEPSWFRRPGVIAVAVAAVFFVGAGATYLVARDRSSEFRVEQTDRGFTPQAQNLHDAAQTWQTLSAISAGAGVLAAGGSAFLFVF